MPTKNNQRPVPSSLALHRTRDFIREHYTRPIPVDELAALAGLSRFHFVRAFSREFGRPPHAYQVRLQVEHARNLIAQGVLPAAAALEAGFADQSHLNRHFKKIHGMTPRQYVIFSRRRR